MVSFRVIEHKVPCQHVREYRQATANSQEDLLFLAVKQYVPLSNPEPSAGDVTIIAATANGFPKELYEPLWDDLEKSIHKYGAKIRSIWMADVAQQGQSGIMNELQLGNDPSWLDHSRDLLHLINLKRDEMPRPLVGIGHSMGGHQIARLALMHPRLLTTLVLIDPVIQPVSAELNPAPKAPPNLAQLSSFRRVLWPSRKEAAAQFRSSAFYRSWDPRVFEKWIEFGLRNVPTVLLPDAQSPQVTLSTTPAQEVFTFLRPNYDGYGVDGKPTNRTTHADINPSLSRLYPFYRAEPPQLFEQLPELRPSALYLFGEKSNVSQAPLNEEKVRRTGTGVGGSGGAKEGRVKGVTFSGVGHLIPMEVAEKTADVTAEWIGAELARSSAEEREWERQWKQKSLEEKQGLDETWRKMVGGNPKAKI